MGTSEYHMNYKKFKKAFFNLFFDLQSIILHHFKNLESVLKFFQDIVE